MINNSTDHFKLYGSLSAVTFEEVVSQKGSHTFNIDFARKTQGTTFDWNNKITIQPTKEQLVQIGVFLLSPSPLKLSLFRGEKSLVFEKKSLQIELVSFNNKALFTKNIITQESKFFVLALVLKKLAENTNIPESSCLEILKLT